MVMKKSDFLDLINKKRRTGDWYCFLGDVDGKEIKLKGFKTWLQTYSVNKVRYSNNMDRSVKQFKADLLRPFNNIN